MNGRGEKWMWMPKLNDGCLGMKKCEVGNGRRKGGGGGRKSASMFYGEMSDLK